MRIATYNVEWFNALFDDEGHLLDDDGPSARYGISRGDQLAALGIVFNALDADAVMVIEAPDTNRKRDTVMALERFADVMGLRARRALMGFVNDTQQEIALLYDPDVMVCRHDPVGDETGRKGSGAYPRFDGVFRIDLDIDAREDLVRFSKPPLEVAVEARGFAFRMIGAHLKSKAPHGAQNRDEAMRMAIANRRKQQAQAIWLRGRIERHLEAGEPLILLGDLNDGPGLDEYESLFGRSSVEVVLGENGSDAMRLHDPHARRALTKRLGAQMTSARFYLKDQKRYLQALLDYVMVSHQFMQKSPEWRIWHPFDDPACYKVPELRNALLAGSDHFPVSLDLGL